MKFATLFITILAFSTISLNVATAVDAAGNKWAQFGFGIIIGISGKDDTQVRALNRCIPKNWQIKEVSPIKDDSVADAPKSTWVKILDVVEKVIKFVCKFKTQILGLIGMKRGKMFLSTYNKNIFESLAKKVADKASKVKDWAVEKFENFKDLASDLAGNIKNFVTAARDKIKAFWNSDTVVKIREWFDCLKGAAEIGMGIKDFIVGFIGKITLISSIAGGNYAGVAKLIIDWICNFPVFRLAFETLADAINEKADIIKKFALYGRFAGYLSKAIVA